MAGYRKGSRKMGMKKMGMSGMKKKMGQGMKPMKVKVKRRPK